MRAQNEICGFRLQRISLLTFQLALQVCPDHHFLFHLGSEIVFSSKTARQIKENKIKSLSQLSNVITQRSQNSLVLKYSARIITSESGTEITTDQIFSGHIYFVQANYAFHIECMPLCKNLMCNLNVSTKMVLYQVRLQNCLSQHTVQEWLVNQILLES